jgi:hypothetical protein
LIEVKPRRARVVVFVDCAYWAIVAHGAIVCDSGKALRVAIFADGAQFAV